MELPRQTTATIREWLVSHGYCDRRDRHSATCYGLWNPPQGDSIIYGQLADTHRWNGLPAEDLVENAKVTINTLPPQSTRTDEHGNFWFKNLPEADYLLKVKLPYDKKEYSFRTEVHGKTGTFLDVAMDEEHNLKEIDY